MSKEDNIRQGGLKNKMAGYTPEPPAEVWTAISDKMHRGRSRQRVLIFLAAAASIALAVTVGSKIILRESSDTFERQILTETSPEKTQTPIAEVQENTGITPSDKSIKEGESIIRPMQSSGNKPLVAGQLEDKVRKVLQEEMDGIQPVQKILVAENQPLDSIAADHEKTTLPEPVFYAPKVNEDSLLQLIHNKYDQEDTWEEESPLKDQSRWQVGAAFSPQLSYRDVGSPTISQNAAVNSSESAKVTYAGGIGVSYKPSKRLSFESGVYYNRMGVNIGDYRSLKANMDLSPQEDFISGSAENVISVTNSMGTIASLDYNLVINTLDETDSRNSYNELAYDQVNMENSSLDLFSQTFEYLEIPFNIRYRIIDRVIKVQLVGGMSTNILVSNSISAITSEDRYVVGNMENVKPVNYSGNAGVGFVYEIFSNFSLNIEPRFRYYLNSINTAALPSTRPYAFGLYTGVNYAF
ncbi:outer membrane beta-barrel protein [Bacteroidota bacterium]